MSDFGVHRVVQDEGKAKEVQVKHKRGCHVGAKNKKRKVKKKPGLEPLCLTYPVATSPIPCLTDKGKEKM